MDDFYSKIQQNLETGEVRISEHGYDELAEDDLSVKEILAGSKDAQLLEKYPDYPKGPCALFLQKDKSGLPVHTVWGIPRGYDKPTVLVTAYRPDPEQWDENFTRRQN